MRRAFVSHSTQDDSYVAELESLLRAANFDDVFNDVSSIKPDEQFWPEIEKRIAEYDTLFVVITAASNNSDWVRREVECARTLGKKVVPLWVEDCPVPAIFQDRDVIDLRRRTRELLRTDISRIFKYAPAELIGREDEEKFITDAWAKALRAENGRPHILTFVALGGEGKTSLIAKWVVDEMSAKGWPGCDAAFAWSFYSQGTREQLTASSDLFLKEALLFFGDKEMAESNKGPFEKGRRLARLCAERRSLLILDGLEPLQYAPSSRAFPPGQLKDQGVAKLLIDLATNNQGLCVVTTRYPLPDLYAFAGKTVLEEKLTRLSRKHGVDLLQKLGVHGSEHSNIPLTDGAPDSEKVNEFEKLVEDVKGHALTLTLLGGFLKRAFHGDIRQRDRVKFEKADEKMDGGHAFRTMAAYEHWLLRDGGDEGGREVAVLRLMGLFDRPADADCLAALRSETIPGLTEPLAGLADEDWEYCLSGLEAAKLLTVNRDASDTLVSLDAHPHLREYFAKQVKEGAPWSHVLRKSLHSVFPRVPITTCAWRAAHWRLYEHLCATTKEGDQPTLEDLQPLYQAVAHGCQAGLYADALENVYAKRLAKRDRKDSARITGWHYCTRAHGAWSQTLGCLAGFFEELWKKPSTQLDEAQREFVMQQAGWMLRSLGRFREAAELLQHALDAAERSHDATEAGVAARNLNQIYEASGDLEKALTHGEQARRFAREAGNKSEELKNLTRLAGTFHAMGDIESATQQFIEAEQLNKNAKNWDSLFTSYQCFLFCELLISKGEHQLAKNLAQSSLEIAIGKSDWSPIATASANLILCQVDLHTALSADQVATPLDMTRFHEAVDQLRRNGELYQLPRGLLARARAHAIKGQLKEAQDDLEEAIQIIVSVNMPLRLLKTDYHLEVARLCLDLAPTETAKHLDQANLLLNGTGFGRRWPGFHLLSARLALVKHDLNVAQEHLDKADYWIRPIDQNGKGFVCHKNEYDRLRSDLATAETSKRVSP
jgi:tetratricopeptide (TPR) repeat protein